MRMLFLLVPKMIFTDDSMSPIIRRTRNRTDVGFGESRLGRLNNRT